MNDKKCNTCNNDNLSYKNVVCDKCVKCIDIKKEIFIYQNWKQRKNKETK